MKENRIVGERWRPRIDEASGLPLEMSTPAGRVLPLMIIPRNNHVEQRCKDRPCRNWDHWEKTYASYLVVPQRVVWFREEKPDWSIHTDFIELDAEHAIARAIVKDEQGTIRATAHKSESRLDFPDFLEKSETSAIGRALALCGYGTAFAPELEENERLADAPTVSGTIGRDGPVGGPDETGADPQAGKATDTAEVEPTPAPAPATAPARKTPARVPSRATRTQAPSAGPDRPTPELLAAAKAQAARCGLLSPEGNEVHLTGEMADELGLRDGIYLLASLTARQVQVFASALLKRAS